MGFKNESLIGEILDRVIMGLDSGEGSLVDQLGQAINVSELSGTIPSIASKSLLARLEDTGLPEGAVAKDFDMEMGQDTYSLLRYVGKSYIADGTRIAADSYGLQTMTLYAKQCREIVAAKLNRKIDTVLRDPAKNQSFAAANPWTDPTNSTPIKDMQAMMELTGYGDTAAFGRDVVEALVCNEEFIARSHNFAQGAVSQGELISQIRALFPNLRKIVLGMNMYDSAAEGLPSQLTYQFDGLFWTGHERGIVKCEQTGAPQTATWRDEHREGTGLRYTRRVDVVREHQDLGVVATGIIA